MYHKEIIEEVKIVVNIRRVVIVTVQWTMYLNLSMLSLMSSNVVLLLIDVPLVYH